MLSNTCLYISVNIEDVPFEEDDWFLTNIRHTGFYHVQYDSGSFERLIDQLTENPYVSFT